ncbi:MAG TPA: cupin domain-containing protein [Bacteroidia bacterium]|nr:cupin domain-containing protein [Bacteroidia bacterium]
MPYIDFRTRKKVKMFDGITGAMYHSDHITFAHVTLEKGADVQAHSHIHEQWTHVIDGEMQFDIDGDKSLLTAGMTAFIPSNTPHSAKAITQCKVIDCFLPVREDFVELEKQVK